MKSRCKSCFWLEETPHPFHCQITGEGFEADELNECHDCWAFEQIQLETLERAYERGYEKGRKERECDPDCQWLNHENNGCDRRHREVPKLSELFGILSPEEVVSE